MRPFGVDKQSSQTKTFKFLGHDHEARNKPFYYFPRAKVLHFVVVKRQPNGGESSGGLEDGVIDARERSPLKRLAPSILGSPPLRPTHRFRNNLFAIQIKVRTNGAQTP